MFVNALQLSQTIGKDLRCDLGNDILSKTAEFKYRIEVR